MLRDAPILGREWLALGNVDDHDRRRTLEGQTSHATPFPVRGEPGAAASTQTAALDNLQQPLSAERSPSKAMMVLQT